ncbi:cellulose binding domain-containing protein [Micromonospora sp. KC723]|uniref:cellulose binding domain-containing protein n=1 Tax=Micromonospora sp. KC723 TaxID=2530381 RepID=UPI0010454ED0|nr:cellulose binding domain-containing protein [Micromonospora sp. KC723]TDB69748.1 hypothetical protein E1165_27720 [Micromonospora sp. KC723]
MRKGSARAVTVLGMAAVIAGTAGGAVAVSAGAATTGCRVDYAVSSQWQGGFGANVAITNLGDPVSSWALTWSFPAGQTVTQAWNASVTQSGSDVTARNVGHNGSIGVNGTVSFGFNGAWSGSNPAPASFALNGVTCTGSVGGSPTASPTSTPSAIPTASPTPTTPPNPTLSPTPAPSPTASPPPGRPPQCSGNSPIVCRFAVSPGNYTVTAWIGDRASAGNTSMSVEARRRLLPAVSTAAGTISAFVFTVNVRQPEGQPTGQGGSGNPGLDITFAGSAPRLSGLTVQVASNPLGVYLAGDSTVCDQPTAPYAGWGQLLPVRVSAGAVVANYGDSGESSASFLSNSALFPTMRPLVKRNDLVFIQFGHNDKSTTASAFRGNLTSMVNQVRARGVSLWVWSSPGGCRR